MTAEFIETPVFPERVSFGITGGPEFSTRVVRTQAGDEFRDMLMAQAKHSYEASLAAKLPVDWEPLLEFFHIVGGRAVGFRFKDWSDYTARQGEGLFAQLTGTTFQMYKRYTSGSATRDRRIQKPRNNSTVVVTGGSSPVVDYTTGIVTVSAGTPTSWIGDFDVPCRFDVDKMSGETVDKTPGGSLIRSWHTIPIIEIPIQ